MASPKEVWSLYLLGFVILVTIGCNNYVEEGKQRRSKKSKELLRSSYGASVVEVRHPMEGVKVPSVYENLLDVSAKPEPAADANEAGVNATGAADEAAEAMPIFWHIEHSGGSSIVRVLGSCFSLVQASSYSSAQLPDQLSVARIGDQKYATADLTTPQGMQQAKAQGLLSSQRHLTDFIVTHRPYHLAQNLLDRSHNGRLFVLLRHPVHIVVSLFHHLKHLPPSHPQHDQTLQAMHIHDWITQQHATLPDNIILRTLLGYSDDRYARALTITDLNTAKVILKQKALVGLLEQKGPAMKRFQKYFGWNTDPSIYKNQARADQCLERSLHWGWLHKTDEHNELDVFNEDTSIYQLIKEKNMFDCELYEYAKYLFWLQGEELHLD